MNDLYNSSTDLSPCCVSLPPGSVPLQTALCTHHHHHHLGVSLSTQRFLLDTCMIWLPLYDEHQYCGSHLEEKIGILLNCKKQKLFPDLEQCTSH